MTTTMTLSDQFNHRDAPHGGEEPFIPRPTWRFFGVIRRWFSDAASIAVPHRARPPLISPAIDREITAIDNFAHFLSTHPDMPIEHRARFLLQILRSCEEIRREAS